MRARFLPLLALVVVLALLLAACGGRGAPSPTATTAAAAAPEPTVAAAEPVTAPIALPPEGSEGYPWWNETVWYEIFVRSFHDSDGDGVGDLQGLISKLDYLNDGDPATTDDLGITGIWLMPVAESPSYHGYDVVDYEAIDEEYGTAEDFKQLMEAAHARGIRVIVDLVLNHSSTQHPWFEAARDGDPEYVDWYRFVEGERPVQFAPWGGNNIWHPAGDDRYYYGIFWSEMPDLNYENPEVTQAAYDVSRFWLEEMGADGFRLDAIRHLFESGRQVENTPETHAWLADYRAFVKSIAPDAYVIGEVWSDTDKVVPYLANDELDSAFEFFTADALLNAASSENAGPVRIAFGLNSRLYPPLEYATFLANHDQNRAFSVLNRDMNHARTAAAMLLTAPGIPFLYYGEEVAMQGRKPDEDIRLPMPWTGDEDASFTDGVPWRTVPPDYKVNNVAAMADDPDSLLSHYRALIALRNAHPALRVGAYTVLDSSTPALFPFLRQSEGESLLVIHNLSGEPVSGYALTLKDAPLTLAEGPAPELLHGLTVEPPTLDADGRFGGYTPIPTLEPYTSYVIQLRP